MRQVNFAQRCANVVAVVRNAAFVAVVDAFTSLSHLQLWLIHTTHHLTGTTGKSKWGKSSEIYRECRGQEYEWYRGYRSIMRTAMQPVPCPTPSSQRPS